MTGLMHPPLGSKTGNGEHGSGEVSEQETAMESSSNRQTLSLHAQTRFLSGLHILLAASVPLPQALRVLLEQESDRALRAVLTKLSHDVKNGDSLAEAAEKTPQGLHPVLIAIFAAGEAGGFLPDAIKNLAHTFREQQQNAARWQNAILPPSILLLVSVAVLCLLFGWVVPEFGAMFTALGKAPPPATAFLLFLGKAGQHLLPAFLLLGSAGAFWLWRWRQNPSNRERSDAALFRLPLLGPLLTQRGGAQLARILALLLKGGVALPAALKLSAASLTNRALQKAVRKASQGILHGQNPENAIKDTPLPKSIADAFALGRETGTLPKLLEATANLLEEDAVLRLERYRALFTPLITLLLGGLIAVIMAGLYLGLTDLYALAG